MIVKAHFLDEATISSRRQLDLVALYCPYPFALAVTIFLAKHSIMGKSQPT
jgi:hypothetical protein